MAGDPVRTFAKEVVITTNGNYTFTRNWGENVTITNADNGEVIDILPIDNEFLIEKITFDTTLDGDDIYSNYIQIERIA